MSDYRAIVKRCRTCKYFLEHYVKLDTCFKTLYDGHCINHEVNKSYARDKFRLRDNCEFWEANDQRKNERRQNIEFVLQCMQERLEEIAVILKDDKN